MLAPGKCAERLVDDNKRYGKLSKDYGLILPRYGGAY